MKEHHDQRYSYKSKNLGVLLTDLRNSSFSLWQEAKRKDSGAVAERLTIWTMGRAQRQTHWVWMGFWELKAYCLVIFICQPGHTSSNNAIPPNPSQTVSLKRKHSNKWNYGAIQITTTLLWICSSFLLCVSKSKLSGIKFEISTYILKKEKEKKNLCLIFSICCWHKSKQTPFFLSFNVVYTEISKL